MKQLKPRSEMCFRYLMSAIVNPSNFNSIYRATKFADIPITII